MARVVSLTNTNPWAKAGVMIRESLAAGSRHVMVVKTPGGTALQRRQETGQASVPTAGVNPGFPYWVRLTRSGNVFTGFTSPNGTAWTSLGSVTVNMATAYVGLAVTSHDNARLATAVIDNVTLTLGAVNAPPTISNIPNQTVAMNGVLGPLAFTVGDVETAAGALALTGSSSDTTLVPLSGIAFGGSGANRTVTITPAAGRAGTATITVNVSDGALAASDTFVLTVTGGTLPSPWASQDLGSPRLAGSATATSGVFTVKGAGNDIWGTADQFHFAWQTMTGDGEIRARVSGVQNTNAGAKAGVMMRQSLTANSRYAMMAITPGNGAAFQRRVSTGGFSQLTAGPQVVAPYWVRLTRVGNVFQGYTSADGVNWTSVGSVTMTLPSQVYFGLCVTSHNNAQLNTSSFDSVTATP